MLRNELNERSPLRLFESSTRGGLGTGNIGVVVARAGLGKTAFLVDVALDDALRGRKVLHVALRQPVERVREYYDEIFLDLARTSGLDDVGAERLEMERNRHIYTFTGKAFSVERLRDTVAFLRDHAQFTPAAVIIDDYEFETATLEDMQELRALAGSMQAEFWMSAVTHRESARDARGIPEPVAHLEAAVSVVVAMAHDGQSVMVRLLKDHDNPNVSGLSLALNPTTMLLMKN